MKLIDDTLKSPSGKYSRKSITAFVSFLITITIGIFIVFNSVVNEYAIKVFDGFMLLTGYLLGATVADKYFNKNKDGMVD